MSKLSRWERIADQGARQLIGDGDVSHLPGAGKRLSLDEKNVPSEFRLAYKIMADNEVLPDWIAAGKALEERERTLRDRLHRRARHYRQDIASAQSRKDARHQAAVETNWRRFVAEFRADIKGYNREALVYNLKLPSSLPKREQLRADKLLERALKEAAG
ncbi:MAG: DUF1992 domain-containing protein [Chloroflexi bacterium]|nr:DUF1992 domain-containing protein [Chloroflexota bacterium]MCY3580954.1 DUF1992 domain-containing protein [Chloroflexota bacterium]MCY3717631.1 DUF1992 domain-containing protein [Chloroflexota bacterium]MDE2650341.1 DUF1992 domain-containing protein [Chloroflexota bacterium]MXV94269.1 DUF1992 domain-containing protein [Chloroflexota bacterium]